MDEIKDLWRQENMAEDTMKSPEEIQSMIGRKARNTVARVSIKLVWEALAFAAVLFICVTGLDLRLTHRAIGWFLAVVLIHGVINNLTQATLSSIHLQGGTLRESLTRVADRFHKQRRFAMLFTVLYFAAMYLFLMSRAELTLPKILLSAILVTGSIGVRLWVENRMWSRRIQEIDVLLSAFSHA